VDVQQAQGGRVGGPDSGSVGSHESQWSPTCLETW
jgi:hypothetical protein